MTVFVGHYGEIELRRIGSSNTLDLEISASDLSVPRKRFTLGTGQGQDIPFGTITTGDRVKISTSDARGLPFRFYKNVANTVFIDNPGAGVLPLEFFANVDTMGAVRMYRNFADAIANPGIRYLAIPLEKASSNPPWKTRVNLLPGSYNTLGQVEGFQISTDRETVDTTALGNKYKDFSSSAISGSGSVDCLFSFKNVLGQEVPLALSQLIQKIEIGSKFAGKFYILKPGLPRPPGYTASEGVYYEVNGILTRSALTLRADALVECTFDFVTSGEFKLKVGDAPVDLTTENNVSIGEEATLDELGVLRETD
jgi:hypothetical protein